MPDQDLPVGVKSLAEIASYPMADQSVLLMTLLEYVLRHARGGFTDTRLTELIAMHGSKFTCPAPDLHKARWVRNQIVHGTGKATHSDINQAVNTLRQGVRDVLQLSNASAAGEQLVHTATA